jgi:very-short-patch-repair endonuclease
MFLVSSIIGGLQQEICRASKENMATSKVRIDYADMLALQLKAFKIEHKREFRFDPERKWRADFLLNHNILVEVDGGNFMARMVNGKPRVIGRHTTDADAEKMNAAALLGYRVLRFSPKMVKEGTAINTIKGLYDNHTKGESDLLVVQKEGSDGGKEDV